ncbi:unnamed protein product [Paramecium sonneborni]|uniref:GST N-terminal domain-containing protein n=1 Tax=Paramecium sonneborni TaxID=65129 RepID=A0A8S1RSA8_9CILI|nr:unnamed protein product [Paramecium sonneborni]
MSITLYFNSYSHRCLSVKTILLLTNYDFNEKIIDVLKGENLKQAFTNINPNQTVPAITKEFFSLFEIFAETNLNLDYILIHYKIKLKQIHIQIGIKMNFLEFQITLKNVI